MWTKERKAIGLVNRLSNIQNMSEKHSQLSLENHATSLLLTAASGNSARSSSESSFLLKVFASPSFPACVLKTLRRSSIALGRSVMVAGKRKYCWSWHPFFYIAVVMPKASLKHMNSTPLPWDTQLKDWKELDEQLVKITDVNAQHTPFFVLRTLGTQSRLLLPLLPLQLSWHDHQT